jgi:hypothetical protein
VKKLLRDQPTDGDLVLQEVWPAKDALSAARGHSIDRLFAEGRERQELSGHPVVNFEKPLGAKRPTKK